MFETRRIGGTGVKVSRVALGSSSLGNLYERVTADQARAVLDTAWQAGVRYFDTAPLYGHGLAEQRVGTFLKDKPRESFALSTKVGRVLTPGGFTDEPDDVWRLPHDMHFDYSASGFERSLAGSLERLRLDRVDILYVHDIGTYFHGKANERHLEALMTSGLPYLERLKKEGTIGAYGLGVNECEICLDILGQHPLDVVQIAGRWTLLDRSAEQELVPRCQRLGVDLVVGGIFNSGILATGVDSIAHFNYRPATEEIREKVRRLQSRCDAAGVQLAKAALQFAASLAAPACLMLGATNPRELEFNLNVLSDPISPRTARLWSD